MALIQYQPEMNSVPVRPASLSERAAYHEAGHCAAALAFGIPIIHVTIDADIPHLHRGRYRAQHAAGLECMVTLCLAGPAAEAYFCGSIDDGGDRIDIDMARQHVARRFEPLRIATEIARLRDAAERLVRTAWAEQRIRLVAEALLERGTLTGEEICGVGDAKRKPAQSMPRAQGSLIKFLHTRRHIRIKPYPEHDLVAFEYPDR
jgi:hypothetical protein